MAYKNLTALNVVNVINQEVNKVYATALPAVTAATFSNMAAQLRKAPQPVQNAWHENLVNLVGMQLVKNKRAFESYFRKLHLGEIATFDIQLQMMDLINARSYSPDADSDDFFEDEKPDIATQYANSVAKLKFPVSINEENLYGAFISQDAFMNYMGTIETQLYSSLEMADVTLVKQLISQNVAEGNIYLVPTAKVVDQATALGFTAKLKSIASDMSVEMSPKYNLSGYNTWTPKDEGVIISDTDTQAVTETYSLAWAFNKEYLALEQGGQAITMANDSIADGAVFALYADRYAFEIRNIVGFPKTVSQYFGNTLTLKRWLHYWALYTISYFNNIVGFADSTKVAAAADVQTLTIATRSGSAAMNKGASDQVYVSALALTTAANTAGKVFDKFGDYSIAGNNSANTVIDAKSGKITIGKDETASTVTVTFTSHLNSNVTATLAITVNGNA